MYLDARVIKYWEFWGFHSGINEVLFDLLEVKKEGTLFSVNQDTVLPTVCGRVTEYLNFPLMV